MYEIMRLHLNAATLNFVYRVSLVEIILCVIIKLSIGFTTIAKKGESPTSKTGTIGIFSL